MHGLSDPSFFAHKKEPRSSRGRGRTDQARLQGSLDVFLHGLLLRPGDRIQPPLRDGSPWDEVNVEVVKANEGEARWPCFY